MGEPDMRAQTAVCHMVAQPAQCLPTMRTFDLLVHCGVRLLETTWPLGRAGLFLDEHCSRCGLRQWGDHKVTHRVCTLALALALALVLALALALALASVV